ncbi:MAG: sigma-E processing peptidase SpoIIGA [Clostridia bacterium]|nr:sigma-E processing peptidase SpoIIGA [Clostridia bacterium]MDD4375333.1 sigma-E processing peptidase SpoIIGA [Clostridia bacterium]
MDYIFIENMIINYLILYETSCILRKKQKAYKNITSSLIGTIYVCALIYFKIQELQYVISKLLLSIIMVYIFFTPKLLKEYIKQILCFYFITIISTGTYLTVIQLLNIQFNKTGTKALIYLIGVLIIKIIEKETRRLKVKERKRESFIFDVILPECKGYGRYKGFIDTGNTAIDHKTGKPIFFIDKNKFTNKKDYKRIITNIQTINGLYSIAGYEIDGIRILNNEKEIKINAIVCNSKDKLENNLGFDMILNYEVYNELMEGCV